MTHESTIQFIVHTHISIRLFNKTFSGQNQLSFRPGLKKIHKSGFKNEDGTWSKNSTSFLLRCIYREFSIVWKFGAHHKLDWTKKSRLNHVRIESTRLYCCCTFSSDQKHNTFLFFKFSALAHQELVFFYFRIKRILLID